MVTKIKGSLLFYNVDGNSTVYYVLLHKENFQYMYFQIQQLTNVPITQLLCIHYNVSCPPQVPTRDQTTRETHRMG